jgi:hypothetical protein
MHLLSLGGATDTEQGGDRRYPLQRGAVLALCQRDPPAEGWAVSDTRGIGTLRLNRLRSRPRISTGEVDGMAANSWLQHAPRWFRKPRYANNVT